MQFLNSSTLEKCVASVRGSLTPNHDGVVPQRGSRTVAKIMRLQWTQDIDIDTLEARGHWATMGETLNVVTYHLPRHDNIVKTCKRSSGQVSPSDLTFATKFVAIYLLIKVKGSRPMTYQYLTANMARAAKENPGFID